MYHTFPLLLGERRSCLALFFLPSLCAQLFAISAGFSPPTQTCKNNPTLLGLRSPRAFPPLLLASRQSLAQTHLAMSTSLGLRLNSTTFDRMFVSSDCHLPCRNSPLSTTEELPTDAMQSPFSFSAKDRFDRLIPPGVFGTCVPGAEFFSRQFFFGRAFMPSRG